MRLTEGRNKHRISDLLHADHLPPVASGPGRTALFPGKTSLKRGEKWVKRQKPAEEALAHLCLALENREGAPRVELFLLRFRREKWIAESRLPNVDWKEFPREGAEARRRNGDLGDSYCSEFAFAVCWSFAFFVF